MAQTREKTIVKLSIQGIIVNLLLVSFKAFVGIISNSIAVILDAVNNLGDAGAQIITLVGTKLSLKKPDKKHPFGYGRIEYLSSAIVASLILVAGITSCKESIIKIFKPEKSEYTISSLIIIGLAVFVKFFFGRYTKAVGKKVSSDALIAAGTDSFMDSILTLSTLIAAIISTYFSINLEGILGFVLSIFIIKAAFEIFKETLGSLIGNRTDSDFSLSVKKRIRQQPGVIGAYDLILHDYGPSRSIGSVHIEVSQSMSAKELHNLTRKIRNDIYKEFGIILTVGIYAANTDEESMHIKEKIVAIAKKNPYFMQLHGLFIDEDEKQIYFDTVISYKAPSAYELAEEIRKEVEVLFPGYGININIDHDFSD